MATNPQAKSPNPWEAAERKSEINKIDKSLSAALAAEKSMEERAAQEKARREMVDKAQAEADKAKERFEKAQKAAEQAQAKADKDGTAKSRGIAENAKMEAIGKHQQAESARRNLEAVSNPKESSQSPAQQVERNRAAQEQKLQKANDISKLNDAEKVAANIVEARNFLAEKHAAQDVRAKNGTLQTDPKTHMSERIRESEHASLLQEKGLSYRDRAELVKAVNLDLDARAVEAKTGRRVESFLDEKHPQHVSGEKAKYTGPAAKEDKESKKEPEPSKKERAAKEDEEKKKPSQPAKPQHKAHEPEKPPAKRPGPAAHQVDKEDGVVKAKADTVASPKDAPTYKEAEVSEIGKDGIKRVYNAADQKERGPLASEIIVENDGSRSIRYAGSKEQVQALEARAKEGPPGSGLKLPETSKTLAPVEDRVINAPPVRAATATAPEQPITNPVHSAQATPRDLGAFGSNVSNPISTSTVAARDLGPLDNGGVITNPIHSAQAAPRDLGPQGTPVSNPIATASASPRDLGPQVAQVENRLEASAANAYKPQDAAAIDSKLMQSAHPKEADKSANVLGQEGPNAEPQRRFSEDTYARADAFLKEQAGRTNQPQEQQRTEEKTAKAAEREQVREMSME